METSRIDYILDAISEAEKNNDADEVRRLTVLLPLPPRLALSGKQTFGSSWMRKQGFDLSRADKVYGEDWLND